MPAAPPVTLINDCCLAFAVLVHNGGERSRAAGAARAAAARRPSLRLLDLSAGHETPVIVMLDAHKHLGAAEEQGGSFERVAGHL